MKDIMERVCEEFQTAFEEAAKELMSQFPKPDWAKEQVVRVRGGRLILEDMCEHGIGHPNRAWYFSLPEDERDGEGIHGCDGCCRK